MGGVRMKYWRKLNGDCGTMDDDGYVPDSIQITKHGYDEHIALIPVVKKSKSDIQKIIEYAKIEGWI